MTTREAGPTVETVHLFLQLNGSPVEGSFAAPAPDGRRDGSIDLLRYEHACVVGSDALRSSGRRTYEPIVVWKYLDKTTPLLWRALTNNQPVAADFKFFRPTPARDGSIEHYYTVRITDGRVVSLRQTAPDNRGGGSAPVVEEVRFVFETISWEWVEGGVMHEDEWSA